jgi:hypothetical protein
MRINVEWCINNMKPTGEDLLMMDPVPVLKMYSQLGGSAHRNCPSYLNHFKNTYVFFSPFDVEVELNKEENSFRIIEPKNINPKEFLNPRFNEEGGSPYPIFSLRLSPLVFNPVDCNKDVYLTQVEPSLEWDRARDIRLIEGGFNISKWKRPLDVAFEQRTKNLTVKFKRGQPIFYLKFSTDDPEDVIVLKRVELTESLRRDIDRCLEVKHLVPNMKLKDMYALRDSYLSQLNQGSKCPHLGLRSLWRRFFSKR